MSHNDVMPYDITSRLSSCFLSQGLEIMVSHVVDGAAVKSPPMLLVHFNCFTGWEAKPSPPKAVSVQMAGTAIAS